MGGMPPGSPGEGDGGIRQELGESAVSGGPSPREVVGIGEGRCNGPEVVARGGDIVGLLAVGALHVLQAFGEPGQFSQHPFEIAHEVIMRYGVAGAKGRSAHPAVR